MSKPFGSKDIVTSKHIQKEEEVDPNLSKLLLNRKPLPGVKHQTCFFFSNNTNCHASIYF